MDRLQAMQTFVRVVERGSFSAVAREQQTTQSAVSKQVAALERLLDARLLTRTTRTLALTEEGERYFGEARRLVAEIAEAESTVRSGAHQLTGWLRVAGSVGFGTRTLLPLVHSFLAAHPDVRIDLKLNDGVIDLVENGIDVALRIGELQDSGLVARRVGTTERVVVAHRDYLKSLPRSQRTLHTPEDLAAHECIVYAGTLVGASWTFVAGPGAAAAPGASTEVRVQGRLVSNSSEVVRAAVLSGMGIGFLPTWLIDDAIAEGSVRRLLPDWLGAPMPVHLVSPPERRASAKVRAFGDHMAAGLAASVTTRRR
jgi:DNA-binding transcriptional LysR family regulator